MFIDRVVVKVKAGKGGNGVIAWRREKYIPKGGPCGGDGGLGGSVVFEADEEVYSLDWYRHRKILNAENGAAGGANNRTGRGGRNLVLKVPLGTLVKNAKTGETIHDFTLDNERWTACKGGRGGRGNTHYKSPTNRAPNICTPGKEGEASEFELELKLIADIGLVGFPNAGKSTLISELAFVKVKIAPYPFTTLQPNIGCIQLESRKTENDAEEANPSEQVKSSFKADKLFIADIPGIIKGAHKNRGLGFEFLRHIERTSLLLYVLDASGIDGRDPASDYQVLLDEIAAYNPELLKRPSFVILNKIDAEESEENIQTFEKAFPNIGKKLFKISALEKVGLDKLLTAIKSEFKT